MLVFLALVMIAFLGLGLYSIRWGIILYLVGALVLPVIWFGEAALRFELIYILWLVFVLFMQKSVSGFTFMWHPILSEYGLFLFLVVLSTMLALISDSSKCSLMQLLIPFYGILRPLLVMFLFLNAPIDEKFVRSLLWAFIWLNIPITLLSIGQSLGVRIAQEITLFGYISPWRDPVLRLINENGLILRSVAVFESPVYSASFFLLALTTAFFLLIMDKHTHSREIVLYISLSSAFLGGITTLSSTFILGTLTVSAFFLVFLLPRYPRRFSRITLVAICGIAILYLLLSPQLMQIEGFSGTLHYQVDRILSGSAFASRYDSSSGIFAITYPAIIERPVLGWGFTSVNGAFVGDSIYIVALYRGGIVGLAMWLLLLVSILICSWRRRGTIDAFGYLNWLVFLFTLILLTTGFGAPSFFIPRLQEWYWAVVGLSLNPKLRTYLTLKRRLE